MSHPQVEARLSRLYERAEPLVDALNEACLGRPLDVVVQALGFALLDAIEREEPVDDAVMRGLNRGVRPYLKGLLTGRNREETLLLLRHEGLCLVYLSTLVDRERLP